MSDIVAFEHTFASGRYSKRKRTQVTYSLSELDVSESESDFETPQPKKQKAKITSRPLPKRKIFPFMKLPAEIRNMIYTYALTEPSGINFVAAFKHKRRTVERVSAETQSVISGRNTYTSRINDQMRAKHTEPISLVPSLLAVSKQIHAEAQDILYGNEFVFADTSALYAFLINLGPSGAKHLQTLRLLGWGHGRTMKTYNHACFAALIWATNITTFYIDTPIGWYRNAKAYAQQIYRDAFPWLEAVGRERGKVDAGVEILQITEESFQNWHFDDPKEQKRQEVKAALSKLLDARQKQIMGKLVKKRKTAKEES